MSIPQNPLENFNSTVAKHVLVAFKYTEDAEKTKITGTIGDAGTIITGAAVHGPGIVVANDFGMGEFNIYSLKWTWDFYGALTQTSGSVVGYLEITDRTGMNFTNFMKQTVTPALGVSEGHMVFALRTFFVGGTLTGDSNDVITGNPLIFNMVSFVNDMSHKSGRFYTMSFVGAATTFGQFNQFSKLYQMTITHSDGNLSNETPSPNVAGCALLTRKAENSKQNNARKTRLDKSKPMRTLGELFSAFEMELNQQKFPHAAQLQNWLQHVNDDYKVKIIPPIQQKIGQIPVDYFVHLDPVYADYPVDNRNLPFEQPDQDQNKKGIRTYTIKTGTDIVLAVKKLMKLSRKVGEETGAGGNGFMFKTVISAIKKSSDRYEIHIVIKRIAIPENHQHSNTGPGESAINPLQFTFQNPAANDKDIINLMAKFTTDSNLSVMEHQTDSPDSLVVYGDREQISVERIPEVDFMKSQYSGLRAMVNPYENLGLEGGVEGTKFDAAVGVELRQQTKFAIEINGNPVLMSDLNRLPSDVATGKVGSAQYYKYPELLPLYAKLVIYLRAFADEGLAEDQSVPTKFYYDNYLMLYRVTNKFEQGQFTQVLDMLRTDKQI